MKNFVIFILCVCIFSVAHAQTTDSKFANMKLAVYLLQEDPATIAKLEKKKEKGEDVLSKYKAFINNYNEYLKYSLEHYWHLCKNIEYKNFDEMKAIEKGNSPSYLMLYYDEFTANDFGGDIAVGPSGLKIETLTFKAANGKGHTYTFPYPIHLQAFRSVSFTDVAITVQNLQSLIEYCEENSTRLTPEDFAKKMADKNCKELASKTLLVDKTLLGKNTSVDDVKNNYQGNYELVDSSMFDDAIKNQTADDAVSLIIPYMIVSGHTGPITSSAIVTFKVVESANGTQIFSSFKNTVGIGDTFYKWQSNDFKKLSPCK